MKHAIYTPLKLIKAVESVPRRTPLRKVEGLMLVVERMIRQRKLIPRSKRKGYSNKWAYAAKNILGWQLKQGGRKQVLLALIHRYSNLSPGRSYFAFIIRNVFTIVSGSHYGNRSNHFSSKLFKCWLVRNTTLATELF